MPATIEPSTGTGESGAGFIVTPASQSAPVSTIATYTLDISASGVAPSGGASFSVTDGGHGGTFSAVTVTVAGGMTTATFTYENAATGEYNITVTGDTGDWTGATASVVCDVTGSGSATGFVLTPVAARWQLKASFPPSYTISLMAGGVPVDAGAGGQPFTLSDGGAGGTFTPSSTVTVPPGAASVSFRYSAPSAGVFVLTASAVGSPYATNFQTAQAQITPQGGASMNPTLANVANGEMWNGYLYGSNLWPDDTIFGTISDLKTQDDLSLKELMDPSSYLAVGVGINERKFTLTAKYMAVDLASLALLRGANITTLTGIADPVAGPTLAIAAGTTAFATGWVAMAYSYVNPFGETNISPIITVDVTTATDQINVTALGALPAGATSVNWYASSQVYATSALAAAGPLYLANQNAGAAWSLTVFPAVTAKPIPGSSSIGTSSTLLKSYGTDQPMFINLHAINKLNPSEHMYFYGCICPKLSEEKKLRDWTSRDVDFNVYGATLPGDTVPTVYARRHF